MCVGRMLRLRLSMTIEGVIAAAGSPGFATKLALRAYSAKHTKLTETSLCLCAFVARNKF
jgi:hypothetical protein